MNQLAARMAGENAARLTLLRVLCAVSVWRTAMTQVLPLCGTAAWWVTIVCLLPGFAVAGLLRLLMRLTCTETLAEAVRACGRKGGIWTFAVALAALLLTDGTTNLTALITLFTKGVGTRGTGFTLSLLTGGALVLCLHREGLPRAAHFLRWLIAAAAIVLAGCLLPEAKLDHLFPLHGEGDASVLSAVKAGAGLAWPVALLLTVPPTRQGRLRSAVLPAFSAVAAMLLLALTVPQELFAGQNALASLLLLPAKYASNALRILYLCVLMITMFLSIGASIQLAAEYLCAPMKRGAAWPPYAMLAALVLTQTGDTKDLWSALSAVQPWLLLPLAGAAVLCLPIAMIRRKNR